MPRALRNLKRWIPPGLGAGIFAVVFELAAYGGNSPTLEPVSFRRDVMQLLSKAGCNAGACHGNANGKGGFKLSLRGEDPAADYRALVEDQFGRRINLINPAQSLLLLKATTTLAHEGGQRFKVEAPGALTLQSWISAGAPDDVGTAPLLVRLEVTPAEKVLVEPENELAISTWAYFADGSRREISREAVYETSNPQVVVTPEGRVQRGNFGETVVLVRYLGLQEPVRVAFVAARPQFRWDEPTAANYVDEHIFAKLRLLRMNPSAPCSDLVFLRRAHLDLLGQLPTPNDARAFLADPATDKRARLVDTLLTRPEYADFWALKWSDLLRVEERTLDRKGMTAFHHWIRAGIATNKPLDQFARELVVARGSTYLHPEANFYRSNRTPIDRALAISQVFLGTRLNCAQCHNHPFDRWSQDDYHDWAALFARINYKVLRNDRKDENDSHEFKGEQVVFVAAKGEVLNPRTGKSAIPRMLGLVVTTVDDQSAANGGIDEAEQATGSPLRRLDELEKVANWLTGPTNTLFARVAVNRVWYHLMGRGLVDPVDDFRATNPASHPALLDALAHDFVRQGFDTRPIIRTIMNSRTYQLAGEPNETNAEDDVNYSHPILRRLTAEQLLQAEHQATGVAFTRTDFPEVTRVAQLPGGAPLKDQRSAVDDGFLKTFGKPKRLLACECERSEATTMAQAFQLISGVTVNRLIADRANVLTHLLEAGKPETEMINELFWTALTRAPEASERSRFTELLGEAKEATEKRAALEDLLWALLNSKEFVFRK